MGKPTRRVVLAGACAGALTACSGYGAGRPAPPPAPAGGGGASTPLAATADIPVGGGTVFADANVVVTQPAEGTFVAFSATCTHQGCLVAEVADGTINCTCHGSRYAVADGSVVGGPAPSPLAEQAITVDDGSITLA